jgi:hypothetical protein
MKYNYVILITFLNISALAQDKNPFSKIVFDSLLIDSFTFHKNWDYPEGIYKDEVTGKFDSNYGDKITKKDTAHLFYTASCTTSVQGGYDLHYAYAYYTVDSFLLIRIEDGLPAYASHYDIIIKGDSFYCKPKTIYPMRVEGEKIYYKIIQQELKFKKAIRLQSKNNLAIFNIQFEEITKIPNKPKHINMHFLRGIIRTPIKKTKFKLKDFYS